MNKVAFVAMLWAISFILLCADLMAADPIPPELRGVADMRSQMEDAIRAASVASSAITGKRAPDIAPAKTPEKEIERRRKLINDARADFDSGVASARAPVGHEGMESAGRRSRGGDSMSGLLGEELRDDGSRSERSPREDPLILDESTMDRLRGERRGSGEGGRSINDEDNERIEFDQETMEMMQRPPKALPIKGRIVIDGGEGGVSAQDRDRKKVSYSVEERFVGNLIVVEPAKEQPGKKPPSKRKKSGGEGSATEYEIDTISTGVRVKSLSGEFCSAIVGGRGGECVEKVPFTRSEVSSENRYGNFHDGVVSGESDGKKVKIEVSSPKVSFKTIGGEGVASVGCSGATFELSASEFTRLAESGSITLTKVMTQSDGADSGCRPGSKITLEMKVE